MEQEQEIMTVKYGEDVIVHIIKNGRSRTTYKAFLPDGVVYQSEDLEWVLRKIKQFRSN